MVSPKLADRRRTRELALAFGCCAVLAACRRSQPDEEGSTRRSTSAVASAPAAPSAPPRPKLELGALRPVPDAELHDTQLLDAGARKPKKARGLLGDWLEGNVYTFRAIAMKPCGAPLGGAGTAASAPAPAAPPSAAPDDPLLRRIVLGAEVEIRTEANLWALPRDLRLRSGGIYFYANSDLNRKLEGCTPLLARSLLKKQGSAKGFVLFEVPEPEPDKLQLIYQPTMFGGASIVLVELKQCVSCAPAKQR